MTQLCASKKGVVIGPFLSETGCGRSSSFQKQGNVYVLSWL